MRVFPVFNFLLTLQCSAHVNRAYSRRLLYKWMNWGSGGSGSSDSLLWLMSTCQLNIMSVQGQFTAYYDLADVCMSSQNFLNFCLAGLVGMFFTSALQIIWMKFCLSIECFGFFVYFIVPVGIFPNLGRFPLGKPAGAESRYPTWVIFLT